MPTPYRTSASGSPRDEDEEDAPELRGGADVQGEQQVDTEPVAPVEPIRLTRAYSRPVAPQPTGPVLGVTGGEIVDQPVRTAPVRLSDDPAIRQQQSLDRAQADFEAKQRERNPFLFSGAVKQLSKVGGRRYEDRAIAEGEQAYADQLRNDRAAAINQRRDEVAAQKLQNEERIQQMLKTGQKYRRDELGNIQPIIGPGDRPLYQPTPWRPGVHPKTKRPVLEMRDQFGQRQYKRPPLRDSEDPTDDSLYADMGDGESQPYMTKAEAAASDDVGLRRMGLASIKKQRAAQATERLAGYRQAADQAQLEIETGRATEAALRQRAEAVATTNPEEYSKLLEQADALADRTRDGGQLSLQRMVAGIDTRLETAALKRDASLIQRDELATNLARRGIDPKTSSLYLQNEARIAEAEKDLESARKQREGLGRLMQPVAAPAVAAPAAAPVSSVREGAKAFTRGVTSEGIYAASEGGSRIFSQSPIRRGMEALEDWATEKIQGFPLTDQQKETRQKMRQRAEEKTGAATVDRFARDYAQATNKVREDIRRALPVDAKFAQSLAGQVSQGAGQLVGTLPMAVAGAPGVAAASIGQIYDEAFQDARRAGADESLAHQTAMTYLPAAALDFIGDKMVVGRILKPLVGKMTVGRLLKDVLVTAATEGATEGGQQAYLNQIASKLAAYDPERPFDQEVLDSALVGALIGGGATVAGEGVRAIAPGEPPAGSPPAEPAPTEPVEPAPAEPQGTGVEEITPVGPDAEFEAALTGEEAQAAVGAADTAEIAADTGITPEPSVTQPVADQSAVADFNAKLAAIPGGPESSLSPDAQPIPQPSPDEPAVSTAEVPAIKPAQAEPDVQPGEEVVAAGRPPIVEQAPEAVAQDRREYDVLQRRMSTLLKARGADAVESPEYQAAWQQSEDIKNRHGGMPPGEVAGGVDPIEADVFHGATQPFASSEIRRPAFFSSNQEVADRFAKSRAKDAGEDNPVPRIISGKVKFSNPKIIDAKGDFAGNIQFGPKSKEYRAALEDSAHDGIVIKNTKDEGDLYIAKDKAIFQEAPTASTPSPEQRLNDAGSDLPPISSLKADQKLAELKAGGITTYNGKPIEDANPAQLSNALGKFRRGELTPEGEPAKERTSDRVIKNLERMKKSNRVPGASYAVDPDDGSPMTPEKRLRNQAHDAAIDFAIVLLRAGRAVADAIRLAVARFRALHKGATDADVAKLTAAIEAASREPPPPAGTAKSAVPESLRERGVPADDIEYDVRKQGEVMNQARAALDRFGPERAERQVANRRLPADTRVALGGLLIERKMAELKGATGAAITQLTRDINRITAAIRSGVSTEAGQGVAMHNKIYENLGVASAMDYTRKVERDRVDQMGGEDAFKAAQDAATEFNKTKDQAARDKAIEALKKRYTTKPVRKMLDHLKGIERAQELNKLGVLTRDDMIDVAANALGLPGVDAPKLQRLSELANAVENAPTPAAKEQARIDLAEQIATYKGTSKMDLETSQLVLNVLFAVNTQAANAGGNAFRLVTELATAAAVNPSNADQLWKGFKSGIPLGWQQAKSIWQTGRGSRDFQDKTMGVASDVDRADYSTLYPELSKPLTTLLNAKKDVLSHVGRFMRMMDAVAYYPAREAYARMAVAKMLDANDPAIDRKVSEILHTTPEAIAAAQKQAASEGYEGIGLARRTADIIEAERGATPEGAKAAEQSEAFAADTTYTNEPEGVAGIAYRAGANLVNKFRIGNVPVLKPWLMFLRTPTNMFNAGLKWTPVGALRAMKGSIRDNKGEGGRRNFSEDEINRMYFQASVGTALMAGAAAAVAKGLMDVTFKGPDDEEKRRQLMATGWRPYSFRIGKGPYTSYRETPMVLPLGIVGKVADGYKYNHQSDREISEQVTGALVNMPFEVAFSTSPMTGMAQLMQAATGRGDVMRGLASIPANLAIPGNRLLSELDRYLDPKVYRSNSLKESLPFVRRGGVEQSDALGMPVEIRPSDRFLGMPNDNPLRKALVEKGLFIPGTFEDTSLSLRGQDRKMTPEELQDYRRMAGQRIYLRLNTPGNILRIQKLPKEAAEKLVRDITTEERRRAKEIVRRSALTAASTK